jgi:D-alanyl-D-alanine carboxypeptidase/D-alanyl-D-alanine-endopeptidase (penicillin-binding protein 4)
VLAETLAAKGITVNGQVVRQRGDRAAYYASEEAERAAWTFVAAHETPLHTVLARTNKDSMNLYAESLIKRLGHAASGEPGSWANGAAVVADYLTSLGIPAEQFKLDDGSGLSKENRLSAAALVRILASNFHGRNREQWVSSLAIADVDGTFSNRFSGTDLRARVFGKSGYVSGVSTFSGYLRARDGQWYAFSILMNNIPAGSNSTMKELQERIVKAVDDNAARLASGG